jgi:hypothetical protein
MVYTYHPSYAGGITKKITVQVGPGIKQELILKNNQSKKAWGMAQLIKH